MTTLRTRKTHGRLGIEPEIKEIERPKWRAFHWPPTTFITTPKARRWNKPIGTTSKPLARWNDTIEKYKERPGNSASKGRLKHQQLGR